jgi:hypothetical protein
MKEIDKSHGSAWDRGSADAYYGREKDPHKWPLGTYKGTRVDEKDLTPEELNEYHSAYDHQTEFKVW